MLKFSTDPEATIEKALNLSGKLLHTDPENLRATYEVDKCVKWIQSNNFQKVCLQFPDNLLPDSSQVALELQKELRQVVYILADTAYESCCIDYVGAAHVNADAVIHFGPRCFSKTSSDIPCLYVYEKRPISVENLAKACLELLESTQTSPENDSPTSPVIVLLDSPYIYRSSDVQKNVPHVRVLPIDCDSLSDLRDSVCVYVGTNDRMLLNISLTHKPRRLYSYNPEQQDPTTDTNSTESNSNNSSLIPYELSRSNKILRRRYYLMEKIKDSNTVGIVIGTVGVKNYMLVIERLKRLLRRCNKKYYMISVGKPTEAKLANFPEIDIFVMVTCALNNIYDSRDYYKPIVAPFDIELALNPDSNDLSDFTFDYFNNEFLNRTLPDKLSKEEMETDVSLITGRIRSCFDSQHDENSTELGDVRCVNSENRVSDKFELGVKNDGIPATSSSGKTDLTTAPVELFAEASFSTTTNKVSENSDLAQRNDPNLLTSMTGKDRNVCQKNNELVVKSDGTLALNSNFGAGYLANRSWKGLEQNLGMTEPSTVQEGRKGIAQSYQNETEHE